MSEKLAVAKLGKSLGLRGFVRLINLSDFPQQFKKGASFFGKNDEIYIIKSFDKSKSAVLFEGYEDTQKAKSLTNLILYKSLEQSRKECKLKEGEYLYYDILGCKVLEEGEILGEVIDIMQNSASHLFLIKTASNLAEKGFIKEFYLPYADFYIKNVDIAKKEIHSQNALILLESLK